MTSTIAPAGGRPGSKSDASGVERIVLKDASHRAAEPPGLENPRGLASHEPPDEHVRDNHAGLRSVCAARSACSFGGGEGTHPRLAIEAGGLPRLAHFQVTAPRTRSAVDQR